VTKSGLADSPFFSQTSNTSIPTESPAIGKSSSEKVKDKIKSQATAKPRNQGTTTLSYHDTVVSSNHDATIQTLRKAVKELGKEAATHRFTVEEKRAVLDLIYSYKGAGIKTSENEIARIAINHILEDYKQNGRNSILDQVLKALNE